MPTENDPVRARILVVEDDCNIRVLYRILLRTRFDLTLTQTVDEALQAASHGRFDLLLLDIHLGEERSGIDLLELLRQMPAYKTTPAVACSAYITPRNQPRFIQQGFDACISKPFTSEDLQAAIEAALSQGAAQLLAA